MEGGDVVEASCGWGERGERRERKEAGGRVDTCMAVVGQ
jgi:hypothetical protein